MPANDQNNAAANASPSFEVKANGAVIPADYNLVSMVVYNSVNRLAHARFIFLDGEASKADFPLSNKPDFLPGSPVEISAGYKGQNTLIFKGLVVKHSIKLKENKSTFLMVDCRHDAVKATKVRKNKIFTDQKDSDIFSSVLQPYSITADATDTKVKHKEMVQFNSSDWDFIVSRAEANGMLVITDNGTLKLSKAVLSGDGVMELKFGGNLLEFDAEMDARHQFETVKASGWDAANQAAVEAEGSAPSGLQQQGNISGNDLSAKTGDATISHKTSASATETELRGIRRCPTIKIQFIKNKGPCKMPGKRKIKSRCAREFAGCGRTI